MLSSLPRRDNSPLAKCGCKKHCMDFYGDHTATCTAHSGATKAHDWMVSVMGTLFRTARHTVRTQQGVTASAGQRRGDVEIRNYLRGQAGSRSLVFDLSIPHDRFCSSSHVQQNGFLSHPQESGLDLDAPLRPAAQRKINSYRQQCADNQNISFLPAIMSTSTRMHGEFLRLLFLQAHRVTEVHFTATGMYRNATNRTLIRLVPFQARGILPVAEDHKSDSRQPKRRQYGSTSMSRDVSW